MKKVSLIAAVLAFTGGVATAAVAAEAPVVSSVTTVSAGLSSPIRAAIDPSGGIAVTDPRAGGVVRYDASGKPIQVITVAAPQGVGVTPDGRLLVGMGDSVGIFSSAGAQLGSLGSGVGQFKMANGIALDGAGNIYVTDSMDHTVQVFRPDGTFNFTFGSMGAGPGQFILPTAIAYEKASGQIAVVDTNNGRVQFFATGGSFQRSVGSIGSGPSRFSSPQGIAFEYSPTGELERMYVVDSYQGNIQVLDASGTFLGYVGEYGKGKGQLFLPSDVLYDSLRNRIIAVNGLGNLTSYALAGAGPVDTSPPALALVGFEPAINETSYTLKGTVEPGSTVSVFVGGSQAGEGAKVTGASWSYDLTNLATGPNTIRISALDAARNETSTTVTLTVNPANVYTITAKAGAGGTITPTATVKSGQSKKYVIAAAAGYHVADVIVDGVSKGAVTSYTFTKVTDNHTIAATFSDMYTLTAAVTSGEGSIEPRTPAVMKHGADVLFTFTPATGWHVSKVLVDGAAKPAATTYALNNLKADHQLSVSFAKNTYKIVAQKVGRGTVTPASTIAPHGTSVPVTITPGAGYHVKDVLVDGVSVGAVTSYTFDNLDKAHTLKATFAINTYTLSSAAYPAQGGTITAGASARYGTSKTFVVKAKPGYRIADVKVDGVSVGAKSSYRVGPLTGEKARDYMVEAFFASTAPVNVSALTDGRNAAGRVQNLTGRLAAPSASVTVNGVKAPVVDGIFSIPVILSEGANVVTIAETTAGAPTVTGTRVLVYQADVPALSVDAPADGSLTDSSVVTVSGTAAAGCQVSVAGTPATVSGNRWSATINLVPGFNTIEVVATDPSGATSAAKRTVILDATLPAVAITSPAEDTVTTASEILLSGRATAPAGATVTATVNGESAEVESADSGFTVRVPTTEDGTYVVTVTVTDPSGKKGTSIRTIIRDATPPAVTVQAPAAGSMVLTGTIETGATVVLRDAGGVIGRGTVAVNSWLFDLADKDYDPTTLTVVATDAAGNVTEVPL